MNSVIKETKLSEILIKNPHLRKYIENWTQTTKNRPEFLKTLTREISTRRDPNIIYPVGDPIFIHIYRDTGLRYNIIQPPMEDELKKKYHQILDEMLRIAPISEMEIPETRFLKRKKEALSRNSTPEKYGLMYTRKR
mgnify:CR=1 FL=1